MPYDTPEKAKAWRVRNAEREKERLRKSYLANKVEIGERRKARYQAGKARELERNKAWSNRNREYHRTLNRAWAKTNPIAARALVARRRAALRSAEGRYRLGDVLKLLIQQENRCAACQDDISNRFEIDHVTPLSRGGSNWPDNIQLLCMPCNRSKSYKTPDEWVKRQYIQVAAH